MSFYHRNKELDILQLTYNQAKTSARMVVITGRRRVGKTMLALKHAENKPHIYLFIAKKAEKLLCMEFHKLISQTFDIPMLGEIYEFKDIFQMLLELSKQRRFVLIIDEFQEFININPSVYSDIQSMWDINKDSSHMQVLFLGSVYSLMHRIFEDSHEPLFGRADRLFHLRPFNPKECYEILKQQNHDSIQTLFNYYVFTGFTPKYIDMLMTNKAFSEKSIINYIFSPGCPLLDEGRTVLIEEFGKEYGIYFSILELIAAGFTSRGQIESILQRDTGGYLEKLDRDYGVIKKFKPITAKPNARLQKYHLRDNFLRFWFRFIYRNRTAVETENFEYLKEIIARDIQTYKGKLLENFFYDCFAMSKQYNKLGSYWERDGSNEIDLVAINDMHKKLVICEVKLQYSKIDLSILKAKSTKLLTFYPGYDVKYLGLTLNDAEDYLK